MKLIAQLLEKWQVTYDVDTSRWPQKHFHQLSLWRNERSESGVFNTAPVKTMVRRVVKGTVPMKASVKNATLSRSWKVTVLTQFLIQSQRPKDVSYLSSYFLT